MLRNGALVARMRAARERSEQRQHAMRYSGRRRAAAATAAARGGLRADLGVRGSGAGKQLAHNGLHLRVRQLTAKLGQRPHGDAELLRPRRGPLVGHRRRQRGQRILARRAPAGTGGQRPQQVAQLLRFHRIGAAGAAACEQAQARPATVGTRAGGESESGAGRRDRARPLDSTRTGAMTAGDGVATLEGNSLIDIHPHFGTYSDVRPRRICDGLRLCRDPEAIVLQRFAEALKQRPELDGTPAFWPKLGEAPKHVGHSCSGRQRERCLILQYA